MSVFHLQLTVLLKYLKLLNYYIKTIQIEEQNEGIMVGTIYRQLCNADVATKPVVVVLC